MPKRSGIGRAMAGEAAVALIEERPDPAVWAIVSTWAKAFEARRGRVPVAESLPGT
jgi:hypothetical protein